MIKSKCEVSVMKKAKRVLAFMMATAVLFIAVRFMFPRPVESVVGYGLNPSRCDILLVMSETSASESVSLDETQKIAVNEVLSSISLRRTFEKGNVIHHKDGFGYYSIAFSDENGQTFLPTIQIDSDGAVFIDCVKYEIVDEAKKADLLELLGTICGR